jgi:hypothetical protein
MCNNKCGGCSNSNNSPTKAEVNAFYDGLAEGVHMYAWWKDSVQYVGTTGRTYRQALAEMEEKRTQALSNAR